MSSVHKLGIRARAFLTLSSGGCLPLLPPQVPKLYPTVRTLCEQAKQMNEDLGRKQVNHLPQHQKPWKIQVVVCLERLPVLLPPRNELEEKFQELQEVLELEHSVLNDLEVNRNEQEQKVKTKKNMTEKEEMIQLEAQRELAAMKEKEDMVEDLKRSFPLADRLTADDRSGNTNSPNRLLDQSLFLLVPNKTNQTNKWVLPEGELTKGETLREAAERVLTATYGQDPRVQFLSNAPSAVTTTKYTPTSNEGELHQGQKVFFYKAHINLEGRKNTETDTNKWLPINDLQRFVTDKYFQKLSRFL